MKKKELKKRIEDGFSQLAPDMLDAVMEAAEEENIVWSQEDSRQLREQKERRIRPRYALSFCTCLAMICMCIFGVFAEKQNHVYMVLDINPSIRIEVNEFRQVESLKGLNQDGKDVVRELNWKRRESVQELLDVLIQDVVEKSYLRDNEGILVTLSASRQDICENLERTLEEGIDRKLTELKVSGVTTAFRQTQNRSEKEGRKVLETELVKCSDLDEEQAQNLSVRELIQYCQDYTSINLKLSEASNKEDETQIQQKKEETQNAISSGDGKKISPDDEIEEVKKQEEKKAEKKGSEEKESEDQPEQSSEEDQSNYVKPQDDTGSGSVDIQDSQKKKEEGSCKQETPAKSEEQAEPGSFGNQESVSKPDTPGQQEEIPKPDDSVHQEGALKPEHSPGQEMEPEESGDLKIPENPSKSENLKEQENGVEPENIRVQETGTWPEEPENQEDTILQECLKPEEGRKQLPLVLKKVKK